MRHWAEWTEVSSLELVYRGVCLRSVQLYNTCFLLYSHTNTNPTDTLISSPSCPPYAFLFSGQESTTWAFITKNNRICWTFFALFPTSQLHRRVKSGVSDREKDIFVFSVRCTDSLGSHIQMYLTLKGWGWYCITHITTAWYKNCTACTSNLHGLGFTGITTYRKLTRMPLFV